MPFGAKRDPKNLITKLEGYPKLIDQKQSMACVEDVAKAAVYFALTRPPFGVYNCVNPGALTTRQIADKMGWDKEWFTEEEFAKAVAAPRSECVLSTQKMQSVFPMQSAEEALENAVINYGD
jgi:dTDP-4-dehydrorhamnose reductase